MAKFKSQPMFERGCGNDDTSATKRARYVTSSGYRVPVPTRTFWLRYSLPATVAALPHVIELLNSMLMTPEEAATEFAESGEVQKLQDLMSREEFSFDLSVATVAAAKSGQTATLALLLLNSEVVEATEAAVAAGRHGVLGVVEMLLLSIDSSAERSRIAWKVMDVAAENGHVDVVKFVMEHVDELAGPYPNCLMASQRSTALNEAIVRGHVEVVRVLLASEMLNWDAAKAFELAVSDGNKNTIELIHELLPALLQLGANDDLMVLMARRGYDASLGYLYDHGHDSVELVGAAFVDAAKYDRIRVLEVLLGTGRVRRKAFELAFEQTSRSGRLSAVRFLFRKTRLSPGCIAKSFEEAGTAAIVKFLYLNTAIPTECISNLFIAAVENNGCHESVEIVACLLRMERVQANMINAMVEVAIACGNSSALELLCAQETTSPSSIIQAFIDAAERDDVGLAMQLWKKPCISSEEIMEALTSAASNGSVHVIDFIVGQKSISSATLTILLRHAAIKQQHSVVDLLYIKLRWSWRVIRDLFASAVRSSNKNIIETLIDIGCITSVAKNEALLTAVREDREEIVALLMKPPRYWPTHKLRHALRLAGHDGIRQIIRNKLASTQR